MNMSEQSQNADPEFSYHLLRSALDQFSRNPGELEPDQFQQVEQRAGKSYQLESLVLSSSEAE